MRFVLCIILLCLFFLPSIFAITGEIGNARAIITRDWNGKETLERTIFVSNPNNIKVDIKLEVSEEIKDIVELVDASFTLQPGEEKNARYKLKVIEEGHWNGRINVFFKPEEGNSVVLSSTIILNVGNSEEEDEIPEELPDDTNETSDDLLEEDDDIDNSTVGFGIKGSREIDSNSSVWPTVLVIGIVVIILAVIVGSIFLLKRR